MTIPDASSVAIAMLQAVPFASTLNITFPEVGVDESGDIRVVAELPDDSAVHNHIGGPHAGALFTLGETASGAVVMAAFGDQLARAVPLAVRAEIVYKKVAMGTVRATARLDRPTADVIAELDAGTRPEFAVRVEVATMDGTPTAQLTVVWTLRPHRP